MTTLTNTPVINHDATPEAEALSPEAIYDQLCQSYRAIDDFRSKLLSFLPFASGAGFLALLGPIANEDTSKLVPVGILGGLVTLGLYFFELYGIRKCKRLIDTGKSLENRGRCETQAVGQFLSRPESVINEPLATAVVYPAVGAAWSYIALIGVSEQAAWVVACALFAGGLTLTLAYSRWWIFRDPQHVVDKASDNR